MYCLNTIRYEIMAEHLEEQGDYKEAEKMLLRAVSIYRTGGKSQSELVSLTYKLALLQDAQGKTIEAERTFKESLEVSRLYYGKKSAWTRKILKSILKLSRQRHSGRRESDLPMNVISL